MTKNKSKRTKPASSAIWWVGGGAVVAVAVLIGISLFSAKEDPTPPAPMVTTAQSDAELNAVRNVKGAATAKVTLVEYIDYL